MINCTDALAMPGVANGAGQPSLIVLEDDNHCMVVVQEVCHAGPALIARLMDGRQRGHHVKNFSYFSSGKELYC